MNTCLCASVYEGALEQAVSGCGSENYGSSRDIGAGMSLAAGHAMMGNYIYDSSETSQCLPGALLLELSEPLYLMIAPWNLE